MFSTDITKERWFMGKGRKISGIREYDSINLGGTKVAIIEVLFESEGSDLYAVIEDESKIGAILAEYFGNHFPKDILLQAKPLNAEQSNSAFYSKGKFFFKLYRRLQAGKHPEAEILEHLNQKEAQGSPKIAPKFYGDFCFKKSGETRTLGILEEHIPDAQNAWDIFTDAHNDNADFYINAAKQLGQTTATMHKALKDLEGTAPQPEEVPYDKLIGLLKANGKENLVPIVQEKQFFFQQKKVIPERVRDDNENTGAFQNGINCSMSNILQPQRIHGDYHLGQLLYKEGKFIVLDFEGEPTRTLEYRRRLRSPAADIAGMLRSFAYAAAVRKANATKDCHAPLQGARNDISENFEKILAETFLQGYSEESGIPVQQLKEEASPYVLDKAIYEACYELEFRPDWFWIPEAALKD